MPYGLIMMMIMNIIVATEISKMSGSCAGGLAESLQEFRNSTDKFISSQPVRRCTPVGCEFFGYEMSAA